MLGKIRSIFKLNLGNFGEKISIISCPVEYLNFVGRKAEGRRQKRCDPASAKDARERAPREAEGFDPIVT